MSAPTPGDAEPETLSCLYDHRGPLMRLAGDLVSPVKVAEGEPGSPLVAVTVLAPGVDPRVSTVLAVPVGKTPTVELRGGAKVSPVALLVQATVPHGAGMGENAAQLIDTTRGLASAVLADPL